MAVTDTGLLIVVWFVIFLLPQDFRICFYKQKTDNKVWCVSCGIYGVFRYKETEITA
jgi:hypothetical protein